MRRSPAAALWYALAILLVVGGPAAVVLLLGTPELALPSEWSEARARIGDGSYPAGYIVDIISGVLALAWGAGLWFLLTGLLKQDQSAHDESSRREHHDESIDDETDVPITGPGSEPDEPWYRQGPPIFDEPFSDEYPRVVVPPDDMIPDDGPQDSVWQPATMTADAGDPLGMLSPDATDEDMFSDAEIIGDVYGSDPDEPPMIVPVRAYYFTRAEDTLRSISAQFLQTPTRWQQLRALNAASPGVAAAGPDTLLPVGTALALPGDPLPWGKPDPVYLWTLAEKFLFTAWGREPTPEEVVPFWRGLTSGTQLEAGAPFRPEHLTAPAPAEPPAPEVAREPAPTPTEPPAAQRLPVTSPACPRDGAPASPSRLPTTIHPTGVRIPRTPNTRTSRIPPVPPYEPPAYESPVPAYDHHPHTNPPYPQPTNQPRTNPPYRHHANHHRTGIRNPYPQPSSQPPSNHHSPHPHTNHRYPQPTNHHHPHTNHPSNQPPSNHHSPRPHTNHPYRHHTNHHHPHTNQPPQPPFTPPTYESPVPPTHEPPA